MEVDALSQGLYFSAAQAAASEAAKRSKQKEEAEKAARTKKNVFSSAIERTQAEFRLKQEGLPPQIAGMSTEEAVVFLKDAADLAAEKLKACQLPENFTDYRQKVSQFMKYIVKNNYTVKQQKHTGLNSRGCKFEPYTQVKMINAKLDEMAQWLLHTHSDTLQMLAKIDEINGLLVDLMAT